jgi:hypothetical protein
VHMSSVHFFHLFRPFIIFANEYPVIAHVFPADMEAYQVHTTPTLNLAWASGLAALRGMVPRTTPATALLRRCSEEVRACRCQHEVKHMRCRVTSGKGYRVHENNSKSRTLESVACGYITVDTESSRNTTQGHPRHSSPNLTLDPVLPRPHLIYT